ncbi:hypothetical protein HPP92_004895 [Vanilla planifolia]|uniref:Phosphofructokinase domain-containing protein n=1 Tax=Vanilla planifolia TaxID=51239 RepID=A0A835VEV8_VANPL|nr:hypothetical protein HPP92_004895 [Vanilla planifolia]
MDDYMMGVICRALKTTRSFERKFYSLSFFNVSLLSPYTTYRISTNVKVRSLKSKAAPFYSKSREETFSKAFPSSLFRVLVVLLGYKPRQTSPAIRAESKPSSPTSNHNLDLRSSLASVKILPGNKGEPKPRSRGLASADLICEPKLVYGEAGYVLEDVPHFADFIPSLPTYPNPLQDNQAYSVVKQYFVNKDDTVAHKIVVHKNNPRGTHFRRAGPRQKVYFQSKREAQRAINAAHVEAESVENGIGVVKLMGRYSGFIAMYATLASRDVDCCLIPESPFHLEGNGGLFSFIEKRLKENGHMVIVVAEGAGQELIAESMRCMDQKDASGNKLLLDIGLWLSQKIKDYFSGKRKNTAINLKYIDPTYMIRAVPSNASDNVYCTLLAHSAIHGAMAGYTGFTVGPVNGRHAYIPFYRVTEKQNKVVITDRMWARLLSSTNQPSFLHQRDIEDSGEDDKASLEYFETDNGHFVGEVCDDVSSTL